MSAFSLFYDEINGSSFESYADYLEKIFKQSDIPVKEVLDLGCGTGGICALLSDRGYDMVGIDLSPDMLTVARERNSGKNTLLLCQDMRSFELYGTVQAVYSSFDCINYLESAEELRDVFSLVHNYLEPGGVFAFDVNTEYRYREVYDGKSYVFENENGMLILRAGYDADEKICEFYIDGFTDCGDGYYRLDSEIQTERLFSDDEIMSCTEGFELLEKSCAKGFDGCAPDEKTYYVFKRQ